MGGTVEGKTVDQLEHDLAVAAEALADHLGGAGMVSFKIVLKQGVAGRNTKVTCTSIEGGTKIKHTYPFTWGSF